MKKNTPYSTHIGAASILLIFMVLSLVSFAALAMINSRADYILTKKLADKNTSFYNACHIGNAFVASTDEALRKMHADAKNEDDYYLSAGELTLSKSIKINDTQTLEIEIVPVFPKHSYDSYYVIRRWQIVTDLNSMELDESLPVYH